MTLLSGRKAISIVLAVGQEMNSSISAIENVIEFGDLGTNFLTVVINSNGKATKAIENYVLTITNEFSQVNYVVAPLIKGNISAVNNEIFNEYSASRDILFIDEQISLYDGVVQELIDVLYADEKHGMVQPRSNSGLTSKIPINNDNYLVESSSEVIFDEINHLLPRWTVVPVASIKCVLIRRQLLLNYGPINENYSEDIAAINDFSWKINNLGYSTVNANHAFVSLNHFGERKCNPAATSIDVERLSALYPHHNQAISHFFELTVDPIDWFSDRLCNQGPKRVLVDLFHMALAYNGSTRNALSFLETLNSMRHSYPDVDFTISSSKEAIAFFDLGKYGMNTISNEKINSTFDLGISVAPIAEIEQILALNKYCLRWVSCHFDIIGLRVNTLLEFNFSRRQVVLDSLIWSNRVIAISNNSVSDLKSFFGDDSSKFLHHTSVIYEGVNEIPLPSTEKHLDFDEQAKNVIERNNFVLVIGNEFPHKHFAEVLATLASQNIGLEIIAFGNQISGRKVSGVTEIAGGHLSDEQVAYLYREAKCVVFPSTYEGFGLPTVEVTAIGNNIVLFDNDVNHEITQRFGIQENVHFFSILSELPNLVKKVSSIHKISPKQLRTLSAYNRELLETTLVELEKDVDPERLTRRVNEFRRVAAYTERLRLSVELCDQKQEKFKASIPGKIAIGINELSKIPRKIYHYLKAQSRQE